MTQATYAQAGSMQRHHGPKAGTGLIAAVSRFLARRRTQRELGRLDDHLLADIGLTRGEIGFAANQAAGDPVPAARNDAVSFLVRLVAELSAARACARAVRELQAMPDHLLQDIGLPRWQIEQAVDGILAAKAPKTESREAPFRAQARPSPVHGLLGRIESALLPLRRWQVTRLAAGQMARFDRDTLADLGYVKGDVDWVPEAMAEKNLTRPANLNKQRAGVA